MMNFCLGRGSIVVGACAEFGDDKFHVNSKIVETHFQKMSYQSILRFNKFLFYTNSLVIKLLVMYSLVIKLLVMLCQVQLYLAKWDLPGK